MSKSFFLIVVISLLSVQGVLAQTNDDYLEKTLFQTWLLESKLEIAELESQFQGDLQRLAIDLEGWKRTFLDEDDIDEVRAKLDDHTQMLRASALTAPLDTEQHKILDLLLLELDRTSQNLTPEHYVREPLRIPYELPPRESDTTVYVQTTSWDDAWDGFGPCPPSVDPWGPHFGRPLHPNSGPFWW